MSNQLPESQILPADCHRQFATRAHGICASVFFFDSQLGFKQALQVLFLLLLLLPGCAHWQKRNHVALGKIYNDLAQLPDHQRNPVIVIPGILGSRLVDSEHDRLVWGEMGLIANNPRSMENLKSLALPMKLGSPLHELRDSIHEDGPLDQMTFKLLGIPFNINAYAQILASLGVGGFRDEHYHGASKMEQVNYGNEHFTCFQFSYDWRRDISETAAELDKFIERSEKLIRQQYQERYGIEDPDIKFDIVAHSMGGLVARYYLRYGNQRLPDNGTMPDLNWAGAKHVGRVVLVGTPNAGSTQAIADMVEGMEIVKPMRRFPAAVIGTMPAAYQLLPRPRHLPLVTKESDSIDVFDFANWQKFGWGLADPRQDRYLKKIMPDINDRDLRRSVAGDHQRKCLALAQQFHESLDVPATPPLGLEFHLFAGDAEPTLHQIMVDDETGKFLTAVNEAGDGVVTRKSATLQEAGGNRPYDAIPWTNKTFISADHLGLTSDRAFVDNVLSLLLEQVDTTRFASD